MTEENQMESRRGQCFKNEYVGTSLVVQWLRFHASNAGGMGLIPDWGTKIPHAMQCAQQLQKISNR